MPNSQVTSETVAILVTVGEELQPITKTIQLELVLRNRTILCIIQRDCIYYVFRRWMQYTTNVEVIGNKVITKQSGKPIVEEQTTNGIEHQSDKVYYTVVSGETKTIQTPDPLYQLLLLLFQLLPQKDL